MTKQVQMNIKLDRLVHVPIRVEQFPLFASLSCSSAFVMKQMSLADYPEVGLQRFVVNVWNSADNGPLRHPLVPLVALFHL